MGKVDIKDQFAYEGISKLWGRLQKSSSQKTHKVEGVMKRAKNMIVIFIDHETIPMFCSSSDMHFILFLFLSFLLSKTPFDVTPRGPQEDSEKRSFGGL